MLHYIFCAAIAYFFTKYVNTRSATFITFAWSGIIATITGVTLGSFIVIGGMELLGVPINKNSLLKSLSQALIWSSIGASAGIYQGRQKAILGKNETISSIPTKSWLGGGIIILILTVSAIVFVGSIVVPIFGSGEPNKIPKSSQEKSLDHPKEKPSGEIDKLLVDAHEFDPLTAVPAVESSPVQSVQQVKDRPLTSEEHYKKIYDAYPNADQLIESNEFKEWEKSLTSKEKDHFISVQKSGTADEVINMFSRFIQWRSTQVLYPTKTKKSCEYKSVMTTEDYYACGITPSK